eukprot:CAMPEP_0177241628 /NCGR_PEP_ID=MMETSP0367-20130122/48375_1 /TAXON_ID=447022 ORGANISM="Scrippsiella hangoei-like, Strain SHHI-4" /NCGR_SAMPLE_ID=MMETSP0367 /ASSEMBLY_ACC=CAM_ASM_000362 /LENGTH=54 /DNA_ID=CAMNT_0018693189 /DNA_START=10 /DNA_END=170 /DNA_ORIENTATION=-
MATAEFNPPKRVCIDQVGSEVEQLKKRIAELEAGTKKNPNEFDPYLQNRVNAQT